METISVLFSADEHYARHCAVTMLSVLENAAAPNNLHFYIISADISKDSVHRLEQVCQYFEAFVSIIPIDLNLFQSLPAFQEHFNLNIYSRLWGAELCQHLEKIIYLDCDIVVLEDIANLASFTLGDQPLAAVPHVQLPYADIFRENFSTHSEDIYFNSGVLVIAADRWRQHQYSQKTLQFCVDNAAKLYFPDQDALNAVFWKIYRHLPGGWNVEARLYKEKLIGLPQSDEIAERIQAPKIIHYTGPDKPWSSRNYVPKRKVYLEYSDRLSQLVGWLPSSNVRHCSSLKLIGFLFSCLYFRLSLIANKYK